MTVAIEVAGITDIRRFCLRVLFEIIVSLHICSDFFNMFCKILNGRFKRLQY